MSGSVLASPDPFLADLDAVHRSAPAPSQRVADVILLLKYALMRPEPVAQIVFAVSAVESLGQDETWSDAQKQLLKELAQIAEQSPTACTAERSEVAASLLDRLGQAIRGRSVSPIFTGAYWPRRGVYLFRQESEHRRDRGERLRIVRVGRHALTSSSRPTRSERLSQPRLSGEISRRQSPRLDF